MRKVVLPCTDYYTVANCRRHSTIKNSTFSVQSGRNGVTDLTSTALSDFNSSVRVVSRLGLVAEFGKEDYSLAPTVGGHQEPSHEERSSTSVPGAS